MKIAESEILVALIVGLAALYWIRRIYLRFGAKPLSEFLLKRKRVRLAMAVRKHASSAKCGGDCDCD